MAYSRNASNMRRRSANAYATVGLETKVLSSDPQQLITLLLQGALTAIAQAKIHMQQNRIAERGAAISKAIDIVDSGLKASVDTDQGGEVANNLVSAYSLVVHHLMNANLHSDIERLNIAEGILKDIHEAWKQITQPQGDNVSQ